MTSRPKIAVVGAGSIGLFYGGHLAHGGQETHFLMRSGYELAKAHGINISSESEGRILLPKIHAHQTPESIGACDLVIIALKTTSNDALPALIPPLLNEHTRLLTLQNGLGNEDFLAQRWGAERVLGGLCFVCLTRENPVTVEHFGHGAISLGEFVRGSSETAGQVAGMFRACGVNAKAVGDLLLERWRKLVWNIPFNGLSVARGGITVDHILERHLPEVHELMREVLAIAAAEDCEIESDFMEVQIERTRLMGPYQPSTLVDWKAGSPLEIEPMWGTPLLRAAASGVSTPALKALHAQLLDADAKRKS